MSTQKYNADQKPLCDEIKSERIAMTMSYEALQAVANALWDLHAQQNRPQEEKLADYPYEEVEKLHTSVYQSCVNALLSMEEKWKTDLKSGK